MRTETPNSYQLQGADVSVTYTTTSIDGKPQLTYHDAHQVRHFSGDEIRTSSSEIGTLVTVTTVQTVDTGYTSFTLLVPTVLLDQTKQAYVATKGITTIHYHSVNPMLDHGQTERYKTTSLKGTAELVTF